MIRVFPHRNHWTPSDELAFVGFPPFQRPGTEDTPVRVSVTFRWHIQLAEQIAESWKMYYRDVQIGGPAYGDPGGEFTPGRFLKTGCTITSRGCPKKCGWCIVPQIWKGKQIELPIKPGWIVQDDNLLACSDVHIRAVFQMLREQKRRCFFNGGLDKHFLKPWHREMFDSISIGELWFACDQRSDIPALEKIAPILAGIPMRKLRCYTMIGYDSESIADAEKRVQAVFDLGFMPFCQLYQPDETKVYPLEWRQVRRKWSRPAAYMAGVV
jgi:hypothetical protein